MQTFVRMSKLSDIVGRSDYISNPARQEDIVAAKCYADWKPYQAFERKHQRSNTPNNEGRELIIALPNEWKKFDDLDMTSHMNHLAQSLLPGKSDYQWAVHWNKAHTNLHMHLIFSERDQKYSGNEVWDRDIYLTQDGKVARRKADRAVDKNGNVKPPVHRKGEPKHQTFTPKDTKFKSKAWLEQAKQTVTEYFKYYREPIEEYGLLHQFHEGKGKQSAEIHEKNQRIKKVNRLFTCLQKIGYIFPENAPEKYKQLKAEIAKDDYSAKLSHFKEIAEYSPKLAVLKNKDEEKAKTILKLLKQENINYLYYSDIKQGHSILIADKHKERADKAINDYMKKLDIPSSPPIQPKPTLNVDKLTALYADCVRQTSIFNFLKNTPENTTAREAYKEGQSAVDRYQAALRDYNKINAQVQETRNPFKKRTFRGEQYEAEKELKLAIYLMEMTLKKQFYVKEGSYGSIINDVRTSLNYLKHEADREERENALIKKVKEENVNVDSVRMAFKRLVDECKGLSIGESREALKTLQSAQIPLLIFETDKYRAKVIAAIEEKIKPIFESKLPKTEEIPEKKEKIKEQEPPQITYGGRTR